MTYPSDWPRCACGDFTIDGKATCGRPVCALGERVGKAGSMAVVCERCGRARCACLRPVELESEIVVCANEGAAFCSCLFCQRMRAAESSDTHAYNHRAAARLVSLLLDASRLPSSQRITLACAALDQAELRGQHDGTIGVCPGQRRCFARGGSRACRVHGCRVCGAVILADVEDWPAPLCPEHAPERWLSWADGLTGLLERFVDAFDGVHNPDCIAWTLGQGRALPDVELERVSSAHSPCSCGALELRNSAREKLGKRSALAHALAAARKGDPS